MNDFHIEDRKLGSGRLLSIYLLISSPRDAQGFQANLKVAGQRIPVAKQVDLFERGVD